MFRPFTTIIPSFCLTCLGIFANPAAVHSSPAVPLTSMAIAAPGDKIPIDVQKSMEQVADLDLLIALTPLHLNVEQIDKLTMALDSVRQSGSDVANQNYASLRTVADDLEKTHVSALKGTEPNPDIKARITKVLDEIGKRTRDAQTAAVRRAVTVSETSLTPEQITSIELQYVAWMGAKIAVPAKYRDDPDGRKAYVEELTLGAFAERILLNQRALDLLHALRATAPPAPVVSTPAATTPAAPTPPAKP